MATDIATVKHRYPAEPNAPRCHTALTRRTNIAAQGASRRDDWADIKAPSPHVREPQRLAAHAPLPPMPLAYRHDMVLCALNVEVVDSWHALESLSANTLTRFAAPPHSPLHGLHVIDCARGVIYFSEQHLFGQGRTGVCRPGLWLDHAGRKRDICLKIFASSDAAHAKREFLAGGYVYGNNDLFFTTPNEGYLLVTNVARGALDDVGYTGPCPQGAFALALHGVLTDLDCLHREGLLHRDIKFNNFQLFARNAEVHVALRDFDNASNVRAPYSVSPMQIAPECLQHPASIPGASHASVASAEVYTASMMLLGLILGIDEAGWSRTTTLAEHERQACITFWEALRLGAPCQMPDICVPGLGATFARRWQAIHSLPAPLSAVLSGLLAYDPDARWTAAEALVAMGTREELEALGLITSEATQPMHWPSQAPVDAALARLHTQLATLPPLAPSKAAAEPAFQALAAQAKRDALGHLGIEQPDADLSDGARFVQEFRAAATRAYTILRRSRPVVVLPILGAGLAVWRLRQAGAGAV